jgi:hypothetical protein
LGLTKNPDKITGAFDLFSFFFRVFRIGEFLVELINTSGGVDKLHLPCKEGVRLARNLKLDQGIFFAILPFDGIPGRGSGFSQESEITGKILENNEPVVGRMNIFFHDVF